MGLIGRCTQLSLISPFCAATLGSEAYICFPSKKYQNKTTDWNLLRTPGSLWLQRNNHATH